MSTCHGPSDPKFVDNLWAWDGTFRSLWGPLLSRYHCQTANGTWAESGLVFFFFFDSELVSEKVSTLSTEVTSSSPTRFLVLLGAMSKLVSQFSNFILKLKLYSKPYLRL